MNKHDRRYSSETRSVEESGENSKKRKSHDGSTPHIRSKRNRYISIAWYGFAFEHFTKLANVNAAMNVKGEKSSVMDKLLAIDVAIYRWNVYMRRIAVPVASRILSKCCSAI